MASNFTPLIEDLTLAYRFRPASEPGQGLVILMHGVGSNEESLLGLASYVPAAYAVALVRFPITLGPGAYCAFTVSFQADGPKIDPVAAEATRQQLQRFVPELQQRYGIGAARTLVGGFSQGGIMAAGLALTTPTCLRGFALLSGRILPEIAPQIAPSSDLQALSALIAHGDADERLPYFWAEQSAALLKEKGIAFEFLRYPMGHEITRQVAADFAAWVTRSLPQP